MTPRNDFFILCLYAGDVNGDWLHVATANPLVVYSMQTNQNFVVCTDLFPLFPYNYFNQSPQIKIVALGGDLFEGQVLFHEQQSNTMLLLNPTDSKLQQIVLSSDSLARTISKQFKQTKYHMYHEKALGNSLVVHPYDGKDLQVINLDTSTVYTISLPFIIDQLHLVSERMWILREKDTNTNYFLSSDQGAEIPNLLTTVATEDIPGRKGFVMDKISANGLPQDILENCQSNLPDVFMPDFVSTTVRLVAGDNLASLAISNPTKVLERFPVSFYSYPRNKEGEKGINSA